MSAGKTRTKSLQLERRSALSGVTAADSPFTNIEAVSHGIYMRGSSGSPARMSTNRIAALTSASTISLDPTAGDIFTLTPGHTATINAASVLTQSITLIITTSGTTSYTLTFGTNFKTTGTLATGTTSAKVFTITFVSDGTNYNEVARTTAM